MTGLERIEEIKKAHQRYVDWWLPIDVAGGSFMAPMSYERFCEWLLTGNDSDWFDRWLPEFIEVNEKHYMKRQLLSVIIDQFINYKTEI